jgi:hypothetical protein
MVVGLLALGGQAFAELCTVDAVPAATLLVPYFEVDLDNANGVTTLFSINNASAAPTIAHVIFWTDWSYPTIDFDIFLTGYDVVGVNVRDVFNGNIPITADAANDPNPPDAISPHHGAHSNNPHWDGSFPFCDQIFPGFNNPVIIGGAFSRLVNGHTGNPVPQLGNDCVGADHGDNVARGYITVDNASECSLVLDPAAAGFSGQYFVNGGTGIANNINQLWGDWFLVDPANNFAQGETLVHIEAHDALNAINIPVLDPGDTSGGTGINPASAAAANVGNATGYTFYGRYLAAGDDNREALGTIWGTRYLNGGVFDQTQLIVWRDSTCDEIVPDDWCGVGPSWYPLNEWEVIAFNEAEDAVEICFFTGGVVSPPDDEDPPCFPYETGRYNWGDAPLDVPFNFGWAYINLNLPPDTCVGDTDFGSSGNIAQSYVATIHSALGRFSVGLEAVELYNACQDFNTDLNGAFQNGDNNVIPFF